MQLKIIFTVINVLSIILLHIIAFIIRPEKNYLKTTKKLLLSATVAIFANILIANAISIEFANFAFCLYFAFLDWIIYYLCLFSIEYTKRDGLLKVYKPLAVFFCFIDTILLFSNLINPKIYSVIGDIDESGLHYFYTKPYLPYFMHLILDYFIVVTGIIVLIVALYQSYDFYRMKYFLVIVTIVLIVILNVLYMLLDLPLDFSVLFYAVAGVLVYYFAALYVPRHIINKTFGLVINYMSEGLVVFDNDRNCIFINETAKRELGISEDNTRILGEIYANATNGQENENPLSFTETYTSKGENPSHYKVHFKNICDKKNRTLSAFFILENVTEEHNALNKMKEAEEEADRANKAKSMFLANMSHEIRTPINVVLGMNEMILRESDDAQIVDYAQNIDTAGNTLLTLINDILDFTKIEAGKLEIVESDYSFKKLIDDCYLMLSPRAEGKNLIFRVKLDENIPSILYGDKKRIIQLVLNIISNAIKYTKEGSIDVDVSFEKLSDDQIKLYICVADTGIGISKENAKKLFNAFVRVDEKRNKNIEGTGLGLAISKQLTELMGGDILLESEEGKGSKFTISFVQKVVDATPISKVKEEKEQKTAEYKQLFTAPSAKILAVDDVAINLKVVKALLKNTLIMIDTVSSGPAAIEACNNNKYDVILMDHMMPGMDGIEAFKIIREGDSVNKNTPVIVLTANAISGSKEEYDKAGFDDYLSKPVKGADLEKIILKHLPKELVDFTLN